MIGGSFSENAFALIIGVSKYKDTEFNKLPYVRADAEGIAKILTDPKMGFKQDKIKVLLDEGATRFEIEDAISDWLFKNADKDSTVFVYFAGHGGKEEDRKGLEKEITYLLPYDSKVGKLFTTGISTSRFHELLASIRSKKLVFFLDACHSGGVCVQKGARDISTEFNPYTKLADGEGRLVIAAAQPEQKSWEDEKLGHGIFTYHLIEALSGAADSNNDGCVTITEVYSYLADTVPKTTMQLTGNKQEPLLTGDLKRDFIMTINSERMDEKNLESIKKKNLERLMEWYNKDEISAEQFELASEVIENNSEKLSDNDKKVSKLVNDLLSDKISISFFRKSVELIKEPEKSSKLGQNVNVSSKNIPGNKTVGGLTKKDPEKKQKEEAEENRKEITGLDLEANNLSRKGDHSLAITKWKEILKLDPKYDEAIKGIKESEQILNEIENQKKHVDELTTEAKLLFKKEDYFGAIEKWTEILEIDPKNQIAKKEIKKIKNKNEEDEKEKTILRLFKESRRLSVEGNHALAISKWQEILVIEPENRKAIEGLRESEKIMREISEMNVYALRLFDEGMYNRALEKWNEVLKIDANNKIALEGIESLKNTQRVKKYCTGCGQPNIRGVKFCTKCGTNLID